MAIRLISSKGSVSDPAALNMRCSGTVWPGSLVSLSRTGGEGVYAGSSTTTTTNIFGICMDYVEGKSDAEVRVIPFTQGQLWEVDCTDAAITAQIGLRHVMNDAKYVRNTSTDLGAGNCFTAVFAAVAMTGSTSGSGKLIGYFRPKELAIPEATATADFVE